MKHIRDLTAVIRATISEDTAVTLLGSLPRNNYTLVTALVTRENASLNHL